MHANINTQLVEKLRLAYVSVDRSMHVCDVSANLFEYGFDNVAVGGDVRDALEFMVGIDDHIELELPLVFSPSGIPVSVNLMPDEEQMVVLIGNASKQAEQHQQLQQAANENELLVGKQKLLMKQLEQASQQLKSKNHQLEEASRLQTGFISGVSHEFRTPLTSIIGYTELLAQELPGDAASQSLIIGENLDHLQSVQRSSKHLLSLVENLLDHGKLDSNEIVLRPKVTCLQEVFDDVKILLSPLCSGKHITLSMETAIPEGLNVVVDDSRLRQCLINLMGNAVKFTDEGEISLMATWERDEIQIEIEDTGLGISQEDLEKIRLPFWQGAHTGKAGTGLGLTITERIIDLMGGDLRIDSVLGQGTSVSFEMPAPQIELPDREAPALKVDGLRILLAEDDSDITDLVSMMLSERGVEVVCVENGQQAIEALAENDIDLILMDLHMPIMTGYEAITAIRASGNQIPIVVMSASALEHDRRQAEDLACNGYLVKPVDIDDLLNIVAQVLV